MCFPSNTDTYSHFDEHIGSNLCVLWVSKREREREERENNTSRALVDAGGLWSSSENMPVLKARLWSSSRSLRTVRRKAAFDSVLVATCVWRVVDTLLFFP